MINVTLFCRPESYRVTSMAIYADNLFENIRKLPDFSIKSFKPQDSHIPLFGRYLTLWVYYPAIVKKQKADINHILDHSISHLMGSLEPGKTVVSCYDLMGLEVSMSTSFLKRKIFWRNVIKNMSKARKIISSSQHTKDDILKHSPYKRDDIIIIYPGVSADFKHIERNKIEERFKFLKPVVLHVGHSNFYKNFEGLIKAVALLDNEVILVKVGPISKKQFKLMKSLKIDFIQFLDLPQEELVQVYNAADLLVYPSWHEGFGFPVLEAMACGSPVICSNVSSLPEVAADAAIMVSPSDIPGIAKAMEKALGSQELRQELSEKGFRQAKKFFWEKTAQETADVYKKIT